MRESRRRAGILEVRGVRRLEGYGSKVHVVVYGPDVPVDINDFTAGEEALSRWEALSVE